MNSYYICLFNKPYYAYMQDIPPITSRGMHEERWALSRMMGQVEECVVSRAFENYPENLSSPIALNPTVP